MFGIGKKKKQPDIDYTFRDGSRLEITKDERRYYPVGGGLNCKDSFVTDDCLQWTDPHPENPRASSQLPLMLNMLLGSAVVGPATFRMFFTPEQKTGVMIFLDSTVDKMNQEVQAEQDRLNTKACETRRQNIIDTCFDVTINSKPAPISNSNLTLGAVACPECGNSVKDPAGNFAKINEALENLDNISPLECSDLVFCKGCGELYNYKIAITEPTKTATPYIPTMEE